MPSDQESTNGNVGIITPQKDHSSVSSRDSGSLLLAISL